MADAYQRWVVGGPAGGMNCVPGAAGPNQVDFAANCDISRGWWETRRGYRAWPAGGANPGTVNNFYVDACVEFRPRGGLPRHILFGTITAGIQAGMSVFSRLQHNGANLVWGATSTVSGFPGRVEGAWSFAETPAGELVVADGRGTVTILVPTQVAGAFSRDSSYGLTPHAFAVGRGAYTDAYAYLSITPRFRAIRWWRERLVGLNDPRYEGGGRLIVFSEVGGGRAGRPRGEFAFPAASNMSIPTNDNQQGVGLGEANGRLIVGMDGSVWASTEDGGTVLERSGVTFRQITGASGWVNPLAGCAVPRDGADVWTYVARDGIYATDGVEAVRLTSRTRTNLGRFWDRFVLKGALRVARARCLSVARRVDYLLPVVSRGTTKSGYRMCLLSWHYDVDEFVVRGLKFPPYASGDEDNYLNATALGVMRSGGREIPWHVASGRVLGTSGRTYQDDVGWRDAARDGVAGSRPQFKMLTTKRPYGSGRTVRPRHLQVTGMESGLSPLLVTALPNPATTEYDSLPTTGGREMAFVRATTPLWTGTGANAATWGGGQTWQPEAELVREAEVGDTEGEHVQLLFDASSMERFKIGGWDYREQRTGRDAQERHDGAE